MKSRKRSRRIIAVVSALVFILLLSQVKPVKAVFGNAHAVAILLRVQTEIMEKTPAGQYYESLFWKHNDELMQISMNHPENEDEFWRVTRLFIPGLEALLDGEGDSVQITAEQIQSLRAEFDWLASVGSSSLRDDIQKEEQRLPLDAFIGMTMTEALDFINSTWSPDAIIEKPLVPDSGGTWAYYVNDEVYFEYPASYNLQISQTQTDAIYFMPSFGIPEIWNPCVLKVRIGHIPADQKDASNPRSRYARENIVWENAIQNTEFPGIEFISSRPSQLNMTIRAFQYNEEHQLAVDILLFGNENPVIATPFDYVEMVNQRYAYFQHMIESLRIP